MQEKYMQEKKKDIYLLFVFFVLDLAIDKVKLREFFKIRKIAQLWCVLHVDKLGVVGVEIKVFPVSLLS